MTRGNSKKIYIGIDPGMSGAVAILSNDNLWQHLYDFDNQESLHRLQQLSNFDIYDPITILAAIEKVHSMPKQGVSSSFKFGTNFGIWQGQLQALKIPYIFVTPQKWQKVVFDSMTKGDRKEMSLDLARRLFPWAELHLKKHHGRAEALLIAEWLRRMDK